MRLLLVLAVSLLMLGCAEKERAVSKPPQTVPFPVYGVTIARSQPNQDARCTCDQAQGVTAVNNDPSRTRASKIEVTISDATLGTIIGKTTRDDLVGANGTVFLGCTIAQDATPRCQKINRFRLLSEAVVNTATAKERTAGFPAIFNNDALTCSRRCEVGGDCLDLGQAGARILAPLILLLDASVNTTGTVRTSDALAKFGLKSSDDKCGRGDIFVDPTAVTNQGRSECVMRMSSGLPPGSALPGDMSLGIAATVIASKGSARSVVAPNTASQMLSFPDRDTGASVEFNKADGTYDDALINLYGGDVHSAVRIDKRVFLATSNGCIAARLP